MVVFCVAYSLFDHTLVYSTNITPVTTTTEVTISSRHGTFVLLLPCVLYIYIYILNLTPTTLAGSRGVGGERDTGEGRLEPPRKCEAKNNKQHRGIITNSVILYSYYYYYCSSSARGDQTNKINRVRYSSSPSSSSVLSRRTLKCNPTKRTPSILLGVPSVDGSGTAYIPSQAPPTLKVATLGQAKARLLVAGVHRDRGQAVLFAPR